MSGRQNHMNFRGNAAASVDAYLEYKRIVGDDDGGKMFTPEEYEAYKKKFIPMRLKNRVFVCWSNSSGVDCKLPGPETECQCSHRLRQHKTDFESIPIERPIILPCKVGGCRCTSFQYIPKLGAQPVRCKCKHFPGAHMEVPPFSCQTAKCDCECFKSAFTCGCREPAYNHHMLVETKEERMARGHPVGRDSPYQGMGGLTGFSSLMEGYMRLDPSGRAFRASEDDVNITAEANESAMRRPGESDMDYFERRYQEREKSKRIAARGSMPAIGKTQGARKTSTSLKEESQNDLSVIGCSRISATSTKNMSSSKISRK